VSERPSIIFLGAGAFGVPTLEALHRTFRLAAIVTQPDKPAGRGMHLTPTPVAQWAAMRAPDVPIFKPVDVNEASVRDEIRRRSIEAACFAWVIIAFGQKLSVPLLDGIFAVNLHASLLPRWRGAAPINAAILAGDTITGNTVITLADRMDAGLILGQSRRAIEPQQTIGELHDLLAADGPALMLDVLARQRAGTLKGHRQDESLVTKARKLSKADGILDFTRPASTLRCQVHGLTPWPGVTITLTLAGKPLRLKLLRVADEPGDDGATESATATPPIAKHASHLIDPQRGTIATASGVLRLITVQPEGGKPMAWPDFARGRSATLASGAAVTSGDAAG
jgi:methionyl-tRNA formyltransferase